ALLLGERSPRWGATALPFSEPFTESFPTLISASTSAVSPSTSSLPEVIFPSKRPSMRNPSSNLRSPAKWLPRSRNPLSVPSGVVPFMAPSFLGSMPLGWLIRDRTLCPRKPLVEPDQFVLRAEPDLDASAAAPADDADACAQY